MGQRTDSSKWFCGRLKQPMTTLRQRWAELWTCGTTTQAAIPSVTLLPWRMPRPFTATRRTGISHQVHSCTILARLNPDAILLKPGKLTAEETEIMRQHVNIGYDMVGRNFFSCSRLKSCWHIKNTTTAQATLED